MPLVSTPERLRNMEQQHKDVFNNKAELQIAQIVAPLVLISLVCALLWIDKNSRKRGFTRFATKVIAVIWFLLIFFLGFKLLVLG